MRPKLSLSLGGESLSILLSQLALILGSGEPIVGSSSFLFFITIVSQFKKKRRHGFYVGDIMG
jgi:hypothetical protein